MPNIRMALETNKASTKSTTLWLSSLVVLLFVLAFVSFDANSAGLSSSAVKSIINVGPEICINPPCPAKEKVTCIFSGSKTMQTCSSKKGSCSSVKLCSVDVAGKMGEKVTWMNTCNKMAATTTIDGNNERLEFRCGIIKGNPEKCTDTDGGRRPNIKGVTQDSNGNEGIDDCLNSGSNGLLVEYYCDNNGKASPYSISCNCFEHITISINEVGC